MGDPDDGSATVTPIQGHPFAPFQLQGPPMPLVDVRLLAPVLPSKVVAIGKNYADHAAEMGGDVPAEHGARHGRRRRSESLRASAQRSSDAKRSMSEFVPDTMMRSWFVTTVLASA